MSWLEVTLEADEKQATDCSDKLENIGALAVSFLDAQDQPLLEPLPGTTPLWNKVKIVGLFAEDTDKKALTKTLQSVFPTLSFTLADLENKEWSWHLAENIFTLCNLVNDYGLLP